jgi:hypothetical protein
MPQDRQRLTTSLFSALAPACLFFVITSLLAGSVSAQSAPGTSPEGAPSSFSLIGTIKSGPFSGAVLQDAAGKQTFYQLHEKLPDGSQIIKVLTDYIVLKESDGSIHEMFIHHEPSKVTTAQRYYSPSDPYAGGRGRPADTPLIDKYKRRHSRNADENADDE